MFKDGIKFYTSKMGEEKLEAYQNNEVIKAVMDKYSSFDIVYVPDKYDVAFVLTEENHNDSFKDKWKIIFFKKVMEIPDLGSGTITLDNIDSLKSSGSRYEIYKELDGSFEDVIKISCDLISKHRSGIEKELKNESESESTGSI